MAEYYLDVDYTDLTLTGTLTFTKDSTTVTGSGTAFTTELQNGDYIRSTDSTYGGTWYKVTGITDDTTLTINSKFLQETHSASVERNRGDGSQSNPFCHLAQYTTDTVRSPGDILYCQLGQVLKWSWQINFDEDGNAVNPIYIIGEDWENTGDSNRFVIDFQNTSVTTAPLYLSYDNFWVFKNLEFYNRHLSTYAAIYPDKSIVKFINCKWNDIGSFCIGGQFGFYYLIDCEFEGVSSIIRSGNAILINPNIISAQKIIDSGRVLLINPSITISNSGYDSGRMCLVVKGSDYSETNFNVNSTYQLPSSYMCKPFLLNGLYVNKTNKTPFFVMEEDNTLFSTGNNSIKIIPNNNKYTGKEFPVAICEWELESVTTDNHTVEVKVMSKNLTTFPTADELYIEVDYLDESSPSYHLGIVKSSEVITANDTETTLSVNFTPAQDGKIRIRVMYGFNSSDTGAAIYVENGFTIN